MDKIILGIDPGTNIMGYGIIGLEGKSMKLITMAALHLGKTGDPYLKLKRIFEKTLELIDEYHPDELAIEAPFYGKNVQSMLKLGRAQGASISAALSRNLPIFEYLPRKVKMSVTGSGSASKEQVSGMLSSLLQYDQVPTHLDATDGLAVAFCHSLQRGASLKSKGKGNENYSGWSAFLKDNPGRKIS